MSDEFTSFEVMKVLNISRERLREWVNRGFISPTISAEGQGTKAVFTLHDLYKIAIFRHLVDSGFHRQAAATICGKIDTGVDSWFEIVSNHLLITINMKYIKGIIKNSVEKNYETPTI